MQHHWKTYLILIAVFIVGLLAGVFLFSNDEPKEKEESQEEEQQVWTCSMHPSVAEDEPGDCPICGMELIPRSSLDGSESLSDYEIKLSSSAIALANITTAKVEKKKVTNKLRLSGTVSANERASTSQASHFPGRIEQLYINTTGQYVQKGQPIASIYSPSIITAQEELLEALKFKDSNPGLVEAAKRKLKQWKLTDKQIASIAESGKAKRELNILSDYNGIVKSLNVAGGDHVKEGTVLYTVLNLNTVWVELDAYSNDLQWINKGDSVSLSFATHPGETVKTTVTFIDPVMQQNTRTVKVRTEVNNRTLELKPGTFATGILSAQQDKEQLAIPRSAILWAGERAIVYVKKSGHDQPVFELREITTGTLAGDVYTVKEGLSEGEEIVAQGTFKVDAALQLAGKNSMMNPKKDDTNEDYSNYTGPAVDMSSLFDAYLSIKDALVNSSGHEAMKAANKMMETVKAIDDPEWDTHAQHLLGQLETIANTHDLKKQRQAFEPLSRKLAGMLDAHHIEGKKAYQQHCPMALDDEGAIWLSSEKKIRNPYFGDKMLKCGEVDKEIKSN